MCEFIIIISVVGIGSLLFASCWFFTSNIYDCYKDCRAKYKRDKIKKKVDIAFDYRLSSLIDDQPFIHQDLKVLKDRISKLEAGEK